MQRKGRDRQTQTRTGIHGHAHTRQQQHTCTLVLSPSRWEHAEDQRDDMHTRETHLFGEAPAEGFSSAAHSGIPEDWGDGLRFGCAVRGKRGPPVVDLADFFQLLFRRRVELRGPPGAAAVARTSLSAGRPEGGGEGSVQGSGGLREGSRQCIDLLQHGIVLIARRLELLRRHLQAGCQCLQLKIVHCTVEA